MPSNRQRVEIEHGRARIASPKRIRVGAEIGPLPGVLDRSAHVVFQRQADRIAGHHERLLFRHGLAPSNSNRKVSRYGAIQSDDRPVGNVHLADDLFLAEIHIVGVELDRSGIGVRHLEAEHGHPFLDFPFTSDAVTGRDNQVRRHQEAGTISRVGLILKWFIRTHRVTVVKVYVLCQSRRVIEKVSSLATHQGQQVFREQDDRGVAGLEDIRVVDLVVVDSVITPVNALEAPAVGLIVTGVSLARLLRDRWNGPVVPRQDDVGGDLFGAVGWIGGFRRSGGPSR